MALRHPGLGLVRTGISRIIPYFLETYLGISIAWMQPMAPLYGESNARTQLLIHPLVAGDNLYFTTETDTLSIVSTAGDIVSSPDDRWSDIFISGYRWRYNPGCTHRI